MARYEIREKQPDDAARSYGVDYPLFVVWDTAKDRPAPFGNHSDPERAERDRARREARGGA